VGLSKLSTIDLVTSHPERGEEGLHIIASLGWPAEREALFYTQLIIKLSRVLEYAEAGEAEGKRYSVIVASTDEPPTSVLDFLRARNVTATMFDPGEGSPMIGREPRFANMPDGEPDVNALQEANAREFADRHGLDGSVDSLLRLDELLEERRRDAGLGPDDVDEDLEDGDLIVLGGAYAGEVLRSAAPAEWVFAPTGFLSPIHIRTTAKERISVNVLAKVHKYLRYGSEDSVHSLITVALSDLVRD
jgi:hypothetical protein